MRCVVDIECNGLVNPTKIWVIVCKDMDTGKVHIWRNLTDDEFEKTAFLEFAEGVSLWVGHNVLGYDFPVLRDLSSFDCTNIADRTIDTLIISKLENYSRPGHSLEDYGEQFGLEKIKFTDFSKYSKEMEDYCVRDCEIALRVYNHHRRYITNPSYQRAILLEHRFQLVVNQLHSNGFAFNGSGARDLLERVRQELAKLDKEILKAFPPREVLIREFTPRATKFGTINRASVPRILHPNIHEYEVGKTYKHTRLEDFNPASHKQLITVLKEAGWSPTDRTKTHIETEREINRLKYQRDKSNEVDLRLKALYNKKIELGTYGWKINEANLSTLPPSAPSPARALAARIMLESRRRTLVEWLSLVRGDGRIHSRFQGLGAWTHRMAHQNPNTANIPNEFDTGGKRKLLGKEMRSLWQAPQDRLLVGVDAEGIQLRVFAHYIDDPEFTKALVEGRKDDKTDPHSLNQRILGPVCKSRQAAKRYVYALLLGAGIGKLAEVLESSEDAAKDALDRLMVRYQGFTHLKEHIIPSDARRGWFTGLDGRSIRIPAETVGSRKHLCMSGYLQAGEAIIMKLATLRWLEEIENDETIKDLLHQGPGVSRLLLSQKSSIVIPRRAGPITSGEVKLVNFVHDEWQTETPEDRTIALRVAEIQSNSLRVVGEELGLKCPMAGSYWNDDHKCHTIGQNWSMTH